MVHVASRKSRLDVEAIGPAQDGQRGNDPTANPPNPQDALFSGPLPLLPSPAQTLRRPFSEVTRPPLHYSDGGGPDESDVTSRRPMVYAPTDNSKLTTDHCEDRPPTGNGPGPVPNTVHTTNGQVIRGT